MLGTWASNSIQPLLNSYFFKSIRHMTILQVTWVALPVATHLLEETLRQIDNHLIKVGIYIKNNIIS